MKVTFNQRWKGFRPGATGEIPDGVANLLIRRRIAEPAESVASAKKGRRRRSKPFIDEAPEPK